jgi:hypothetical protein
MTTQLELLFEAYRRARRDDKDTSKLAARNAERFAHTHFAAILEALRQGDGTIYEIAHRCWERGKGLNHVQVARRMPELARAGFVVDTGDTRPATGQPYKLSRCTVWRLK